MRVRTHNDHLIATRLTADEAQTIRRLATAERRSVSAWLRSVLRAVIREQDPAAANPAIGRMTALREQIRAQVQR